LLVPEHVRCIVGGRLKNCSRLHNWLEMLVVDSRNVSAILLRAVFAGLVSSRDMRLLVAGAMALVASCVSRQERIVLGNAERVRTDDAGIVRFDDCVG